MRELPAFLKQTGWTNLSQLYAQCVHGRAANDPGVCGGSGAEAGELRSEFAEHAAECAVCLWWTAATGSLRDIQVKRNGETIDHFDLYDLLLRGDKTNDIPLATGDVIFIPFAGPQVAVLGSVNHPAIYELKGQTSVAQALGFAGGENALASGADVLLERVYEHENRNVELVSQDESKTEMMQGGDILSVRAVVDRFSNAVTLRGNVANPGRYSWNPGMKVSDLIPNRESLITRDYWRKRISWGSSFWTRARSRQRSRQSGYSRARATATAVAGSCGYSSRFGELRQQQLAGTQTQDGQGYGISSLPRETISMPNGTAGIRTAEVALLWQQQNRVRHNGQTPRTAGGMRCGFVEWRRKLGGRGFDGRIGALPGKESTSC